MPAVIVLDRDPVCTSKFWDALFKQAGTTLKMSSSYHPQTDRQTEHVNQCIMTFLRCFIHTCPKKRKGWLASAEFWYNASFLSALGRLSFEALYGWQLHVLGICSQPAAGGRFIG
jgi:hypothetical protein